MTRISFNVPTELDGLMKRMRPYDPDPGGSITDDNRAGFILGILAGWFHAGGEHDLAVKVLQVNAELFQS